MPNESQKGGGWWDTYGDDLSNWAMMYWLQQRQDQRDSRPPQMTPVPLTPEQQWRFDRGRELFNYSPMRDYVGQYSHQFLQGLNGPNGLSAPGQNHRWLSPNMQGQSFAGGIQFPRINMSNMPQYWGNNRPTTPGQPGGQPARPGQPGGGVSGGGGFQPNGPVGNGRLNDIGGTGDPFPTDARMPETWGDRNVITPGNRPGMTGDPGMWNNRPGPGEPGQRPGGAPPGTAFGDGSEFASFTQLVRTYGFPAAQAIMGILTMNPRMTVQAAIEIYRRQQQQNPTPAPINNNPGGGSGFIPGSISGGGRP